MLFWLRGWIPPIDWIQNYNPRKDLVQDVIAGLTVGIMSIPQGMAYAMLSGLSPEIGLYTSVFPPIIYTIFGTSRHISFGTVAIISLMVHGALSKDLEGNPCQILGDSVGVDEIEWWCGKKNVPLKDINQKELLETSVTLTLMVGMVQILLGVLNLGFISVYLSDHLIEGLTTGAAIHVFASQLAHVTGISGLPATSKPLGVIKRIVCLASKLHETNPATLSTSLFCIVFLVLVKEVVDPLTRPKIKFPIPVELLVVAFSTLASWQLDFNKKFKIRIVGKIPSGLLPPTLPKMKNFSDLIGDAFSIGIVTFSMMISVGKLLSRKKDYKMDPNQEWFASGIAHVISSFFWCHCAGPSLSRSLIQSNYGGKTQIVALVSSALILIVILALTSLFENLPQCALAAIILVALKGVFLQLRKLPAIFTLSKIDFLIWVVTFLTVFFTNIMYGLVSGVGISLLTVVFRSQWPDSVSMGKIPGTRIYKGMNAYSGAKPISGVIIYRFDCPVYFANAELFKSELYKVTGVDPFVEKGRRKKLKRKLKLTSEELNELELEEISALTEGEGGPQAPKSKERLHHIVIDCSSFPYIDSMGVSALADVYLAYEALDITVFFAHCKVGVRQMFERCGFYHKVPKKFLFVNIHEAVEAGIRTELQKSITSLSSTQRSESFKMLSP